MGAARRCMCVVLVAGHLSRRNLLAMASLATVTAPLPVFKHVIMCVRSSEWLTN
jgi:hypothetical protein